MATNDFYGMESQQYRAPNIIGNAKAARQRSQQGDSPQMNMSGLMNTESATAGVLNQMSIESENLRKQQALDDRMKYQNQMLQSQVNGLGNAENIVNSNANQGNSNVNVTGSNAAKGSYLDKLANTESKGNYNAYNKGSKAFGKYQFIPSTEKDIASKLGISIQEARTPAGQEKMINYFTNQNKRGLEKAGYKATDTNLWYAHNLGLGGAKTLLRGGKVNPLHITSNQAKDQQGYINKWGSRFGNQSTYGQQKQEQIGLSQEEMNDLDKILGQYAYTG